MSFYVEIKSCLVIIYLFLINLQSTPRLFHEKTVRIMASRRRIYQYSRRRIYQYSCRRIYQYNVDEFRFQDLPSFQNA